MSDFNKIQAKKRIEEIYDNIDNYDVSTFKAHLRQLAKDVDRRDVEDQTDFTFLRSAS